MKTKIILALVFLALFALVVVENSQDVDFQLFFWEMRVSKIILVPLLFFLGVLFGLALGLGGRRAKKEEKHGEVK